MRYLLDTNTCIRYLNQRAPNAIARLHAVDESDVVPCSVVRAELYFGALRSQTPESTITRQRTFMERFVSLPFDDAAAEFYARIRAALERGSTPVGSNDLMIAPCHCAGA